MLKFLYVIYSLFVIALALLVFKGKIYLEQYNMYFICFCLSVPIFISLLNKFEVIKIGTFLELSKKLDFIEKQQNLLFKQVSVISNKTEIHNHYVAESQDSTNNINDIKNNDNSSQYFNEQDEKLILKHFLKYKNPNDIDLKPQDIVYSGLDGYKNKVRFDAYFKEYNAECFIELKMTKCSIEVEKFIKRQIESIKVYNKANNRNACLILLLADFTKLDKTKIDDIISKLKLRMNDYIKENLLYIEHYSYDDVQQILKKS